MRTHGRDDGHCKLWKSAEEFNESKIQQKFPPKIPQMPFEDFEGGIE
jgi:hypothetical protein